MRFHIPHNRPTLGAGEIAAASQALEGGWIAQGPQTEEFEREICAYFDLPERHAIVVSSGSAALYLALWALQGGGKKIGFPVYSCAALRNAVAMIGGTSVYLDCESDDPNLDVAAARAAGAQILIAPMMFGIPSQLEAAAGIDIVEDIAQALGARMAGALIGLRGKLGVCSFYATKMITSAGQGGAVISRDRALIDAIRDYREFDQRFDHKPRFNFQMTDVQAAVGRVQLSRLGEFIERRETLFDIYKQWSLPLMERGAHGGEPVRFRAIVRTGTPEVLIDRLAKTGVKAIVPIEKRELLDDAAAYPRAERLVATTVSLPIYPTLLEADARFIAETVARMA